MFAMGPGPSATFSHTGRVENWPVGNQQRTVMSRAAVPQIPGHLAFLQNGEQPECKPSEHDIYADHHLPIAFECTELDALKRSSRVHAAAPLERDNPIEAP